MKPSLLLQKHRAQVLDIAMRHHVQNIRVFGSASKGEDTASSDLDLLVEPTQHTSSFDIGGIQFEVSELLGIPVDVLTPLAIPADWRDRVLKEAVPL